MNEWTDYSTHDITVTMHHWWSDQIPLDSPVGLRCPPPMTHSGPLYPEISNRSDTPGLMLRANDYQSFSALSPTNLFGAVHTGLNENHRARRDVRRKSGGERCVILNMSEHCCMRTCGQIWTRTLPPYHLSFADVWSELEVGKGPQAHHQVTFT